MNVRKATYEKVIADESEETIKDIYSVLKTLKYPTKEETLDGYDLHEIAEMTRTHTISQPRLDTISEKLKGSWHIYENKVLNENNLDTFLKVLDKKLGYHSFDVTVDIKKKNKKSNVFVVVEDNGKSKSYFVSNSKDTDKARLLTFLSNPHFGASRTIEVVYESVYGEIETDFSRMKERLQGTLKELQRMFSEVPLKPRLVFTNKSVSLVLQ